MEKPTFEVHVSLLEDDRLEIEVDIKVQDLEDIVINFMHISEQLADALDMTHKRFLISCLDIVDEFELVERSDMN